MNQTIIDYAIWQAIHDLESCCRHRVSGLQIDPVDIEYKPKIKAALEILKLCGIEVTQTTKYPTITINYNKNTNPYFGKAN